MPGKIDSSAFLELLLEFVHFQGDEKSILDFLEQSLKPVFGSRSFKLTRFANGESRSQPPAVQSWLKNTDQLSALYPSSEVPPNVTRHLGITRFHRMIFPIRHALFQPEIRALMLVSRCEPEVAMILQNFTAAAGIKISLAQISLKLDALIAGHQMNQVAALLLHELKNKLIPPSTFFQTLPEKRQDERFFDHFAPLAAAEIESMRRQIENFLHYGRDRTASAENRRLPFFLTVRQLMDLLEPECRKSEVRVILKINETMRLPLDSGPLRDILFNLVWNALHAMRDSPLPRSLTLATFQNQKVSGFSVGDTGAGIPPGVRKRIFEPFFTTKARGSGLGLNVVKREVELAGGRVQCRVKGRGTEFRVIFPRRLDGNLRGPAGQIASR